MPPLSRQPEIPQGARSFLEAAQGNGPRNLKEKYRGKPLELAEKLGVKLPRKPVLVMLELGVLTEEEAKERFGVIQPGLRELVESVCNLEIHSAAAVAGRGTGKSYGASFIEFYLWMIYDFDCLNLGGSELQADQVYQYLLGYLESDPFWLDQVRGDPQKERTYKKNDAWVRVLTASQKSVRSPHAGGLRKGLWRGGILVIDEEAETEKEIVDAALPTINTARPSVSLRISTFHNLQGSFQELVDNHVEMGYRLHKWDVFDVAEACGCVGGCQSEEPCFRDDHWEDFVDPESGEQTRKLVHKAYSFLGQEIVIVRSPSQEVICTTLEDLHSWFTGGGRKKAASVPDGWEIFDTITSPARWESNVQWTPLKRVSKHRPEVPLRTVQAGSGDSITVTDDHPFLVTRGQEDTFIPAEEVMLGDNCVIPNVTKHLASESFQIDEHLAYLVGLFLAEGNMGVTSRSSKWVILGGLNTPDRAAKEAGAAGLNCRVRPHSHRGWNVWFGKDFYDKLASLGLGHETAYAKRMPTNLLSWSQEATAALLCGLIDGDGTIHHSKATEVFNELSSVSIRVASKALITQALLCLRKLGMSGWTNYVGYYTTGFAANHPLYRLEFSISGEKLDLFEMSEKISEGMWLRTRNYPKPSSSRQKQVRSIKEADLGSQEFVYDVTTGSETFWCSGFRTHNCGGRSAYASGWIAMDEIVKLWKRMRRNHGRWEVEAMGSRPSSAGFVIKDLLKYSENIVPETGAELYKSGFPVTVTIDWGTVNGAVEVWQEQMNKHVQLRADLLQDNNETQILGAVLGYAAEFQADLVEVAADIGGGGNYLNKKLRDEYRLPVRDVNFGEEKESAIAAMNIFNEAGEIVVPAEHVEFHAQMRGWRRKNGRVVKADDHLCDSAICYFSKFIERLGVKKIRVAPRSFSTNGNVRESGQAVSVKPSSVSLTGKRPRIPVVRTLRSKSSR